MIVVLVHVKHRKKIEGHKRKLSSVRHQTCIVPSRNHEPSNELLRFVRGVCPNFGQTCQYFLLHHLGGMTSHQPWFHVFLIFLIFWNLNDMALHACVQAVTPICLKIPSNLLHMELTRTQVHKNMIFQIFMVRRCM